MPIAALGLIRSDDLRLSFTWSSPERNGHTKAETIQWLLRANLLNIFGEGDEPRRRSAFAEIWHAECVLVNADGRHVERVEMNQTVN